MADRPRLFVELCAGLASVSLRLQGGARCRPPVSRMGNKAGYSQAILAALGILAGLFFAIEVLAIFVGFLLARSITGSVHALSKGTEHVRNGDFSYKVQIRSHDQLGELAGPGGSMANLRHGRSGHDGFSKR